MALSFSQIVTLLIIPVQVYKNIFFLKKENLLIIMALQNYGLMVPALLLKKRGKDSLCLSLFFCV